MFGRKIVSFEDFEKERAALGTIVAVSGGFDPIHPGHISYIQEAKKLGDALVVIINGDAFLRAKKGKPFQDLETRSAIVSAMRGVDYVIPFEIENDQTVRVALARIRPHIFANGGDRKDAATIPEWETCLEHNIKLVQGIRYGSIPCNHPHLVDYVHGIYNKSSSSQGSPRGSVLGKTMWLEYEEGLSALGILTSCYCAVVQTGYTCRIPANPYTVISASLSSEVFNS